MEYIETSCTSNSHMGICYHISNDMIQFTFTKQPYIYTNFQLASSSDHKLVKLPHYSLELARCS